MKFSHSLVLALLFCFSASAAERYALDSANCYKGPSKDSGRYFFAPTAKTPMTLDKGDKYNVIEEQGAWAKVVLFTSSPDKTAWVESKYLSTSPDAKVISGKIAERLESFDNLNRTGNWKALYAGTTQTGTVLTISVTDIWSKSSQDVRSSFVQNMATLFFGMGGARGLSEDPKDFRFNIRHLLSGRIVATWDGVRGTSLKD